MGFTDDFKRTADDLQVEAERAFNKAMDKASDLAHDHKGTVSGWLSKAGDKVNAKTQGNHADKVSKVADQVNAGVDRLAKRRHPEE